MKNQFELRVNAYILSIPMFGVVTLLYVLNEYEKKELYMECKAILIAIEDQNERFDVCDKLPTHLSQINPAEYLAHAAQILHLKNYEPLKTIDYDIVRLKEFIKSKI